MTTPSVTSSAASFISVVSNGVVTNLEDALDQMMKDVQKLLNDLHSGVREVIAAGASTDPEEFKERVEFIDEICDLITNLGRLVEEVPEMAKDIQGTPPAACKAWWAAHKIERKAQLAEEKAGHKAQTDRAKAALAAKLAERKEADLVAFNGEILSPQEALDKGMMGIQRMMNALHMDMCKLASLTEQEIDEDDDFKESVGFAERSSDIVKKLVWVLEEVTIHVIGFIGKPPADSKAWFMAHKAERKLQLAAEKAEYKAANERAKLELKTMRAAEAAEA